MIEIDWRYSYGIPVILAVCFTICFEQGWGIPGLLAVLAIVVFTSGYRSVFVRWLPLRHYDDGDP